MRYDPAQGLGLSTCQPSQQPLLLIPAFHTAQAPTSKADRSLTPVSMGLGLLAGHCLPSTRIQKGERAFVKEWERKKK